MNSAATTLPLLTLLSGAAMAQSSLSVSGVVDVSLTAGRGSVSNRMQLSSGNLDGGRLSIRGTEDLGNGYKAFFWLESQIWNDSGTGVAVNANTPATSLGLTFNRVRLLGVIGPWGQLRVGRTYTPTFLAHAIHDPSGVTGLMAAQSVMGALSLASPTGVRASNSIGYLSPAVTRGLAVQAMVALGENGHDGWTAARHDGGYAGLRLTYGASGIDVTTAAAVHKRTQFGDLREWVLGIKADIDAVKLWATWVSNSTGTANSMRGAMFAITHQSGPLLLKASLSRSVQTSYTGTAVGSTTKVALGAVYNLSSSTALYATMARTANGHGAAVTPAPGIAVTAPNRHGNGLELGIRQRF